MTIDFKLLTSVSRPLTSDLAQTFRDLPGSPTERVLDRGRLKHLRQKADEGLLVTFHWATARMPDGRVFRVNGQHSSAMLCDLNGAFPDGAHAHIDEYEVSSPEGLAQLFRQFDDRKSSRSSSDVAAAYQGLEQELADTAKPIAKIGVEAVAWFRRYVEGVSAPVGDEQYSLFHESTLHRYLKWLNDVFSIKTPELKRVPVVAAMHGTFEKNETESRAFWMMVARGGKEYDDNHPATVLDTWLKSSKEERADLKPGEFYRGCVYAWNAYREEKSIRDIRYDMGKAARPISD